MNTLAEPNYLSKNEAATYTSLSTRMLEGAIARHQLRAFRVGKRVLFLRADLDDFIQRRPIGYEAEGRP